MNIKQAYEISGEKDGHRVESRILEEQIQAAVAEGNRHLLIKALGQHGIGGRLWKAGNEPVHVNIYGQCGQRVGAMGYPNTVIEIMGPASDDVGWLNAGAHITVHGNAGNGVANAMAQGKIYVAGNIGARGMTMTKHNPRMAPPELWVLGSAGDYFGEFMAGGIAVICGYNAQNPKNVIGYRPLVGMVGGKVFFRGYYQGYSETDAKLMPLPDEDWNWLSDNLRSFVDRINQQDLLQSFLIRDDWRLIAAKTPRERVTREKCSMAAFRTGIWEKELGQGGLIGDLTTLDRSPVPVVATGALRRFVPVWENNVYLAPCTASCPAGIPVQKRWQLIREGRVDEAVDLALSYTPFPATVCGYLCPTLCMEACTRQIQAMPPLDITTLGRASIAAKTPVLPEISNKKIAVIGAGPAGISVAWQLRLMGHGAVLYDMAEKPGGKITLAIPESRIPEEVVEAELARATEVIPHVRLARKLQKEDMEKIKAESDFIVIASGAHTPRVLDVPGKERMSSAMDFLSRARTGAVIPGKKLVIIGAGNVGCDVATEAKRLGAEEITLIDIMAPASFGKEKAAAEKAGAKFRWPCFTKAITTDGVELSTGETIPADSVVIAIGDMPDLSFLPDDVETQRGFIRVDENYQTTSEKFFAVGDAVKPGLLTDAIGAGRMAARTISDIIAGRRPAGGARKMIDKSRIVLEYFDPRVTAFDDAMQCGSQCASCGACRDCGICEAVCPQAAISRIEPEQETFEYVVDPDRCIGCGFCAGACPCGIWNLVENDPLE